MNVIYRIVMIILGGPVGMIVIPVSTILFCGVFGIPAPELGKLVGTGFVLGVLLGIFAPQIIELFSSLFSS